MTAPSGLWGILIAIVVGVIFTGIVPESWLEWVFSRHSWDWIVLLAFGAIIFVFVALFIYCFLTDPVNPGKMFPRKR